MSPPFETVENIDAQLNVQRRLLAQARTREDRAKTIHEINRLLDLRNDLGKGQK